MVPSKSLILAGAALASFGAVSTAQQSSKVARYTKPLKTVSLDMSTGTITRGAQAGNKALVTVDDFPNVDLGGFVGVDTGSGACEWIDAGTKGSNASDFVSNLLFAYCSASLDTNSGGNGGSLTLSFREGYLAGGGTQGTEIGRFSFTGLPANTASSSFFGGFRCFFIGVTFGNTPLCFADGAIGYGFQFDDLGTDGVLASTFPFLSCVTSCSGNGPDGIGMIDFVDQYCPPGSLLSSFTFGTANAGGPGQTFTSISMSIREAASTSHTTSSFDPNGNSVSLTETAAAVLNNPWNVNLDCTGQPAGGVYLIRITVFGKLGTPVILPQGALYINGKVQDFSGVHTGNVVNPGPPSGIPIPKDLSFACLPFQVQGFCGQTGGGGQLSNALCSTVDVP